MRCHVLSRLNALPCRLIDPGRACCTRNIHSFCLNAAHTLGTLRRSAQFLNSRCSHSSVGIYLGCTHLRRFQCTSLSHRSNNSDHGLILGIETTCDDTGCAVMSTDGRLLGHALHSQMTVHRRHGGVIPLFARQMHAEHIERVVDESLAAAGLRSASDCSAIAVAVRPGLGLSLMVGLMYAKRLCRRGRLPLIPVHHMQAHALTCRLKPAGVRFPFLVLLISGGHALLAVARDVDDFLLLGASRDNAPGEVLDKVARRLRLHHVPSLTGLSGGQCVEKMADVGDPLRFPLPQPLTNDKDCSFSFSGLRTATMRLIANEEVRVDLPPSDVLPSAADVCASLQYAMARHLCRRTYRALEFCRLRNLLPFGTHSNKGEIIEAIKESNDISDKGVSNESGLKLEEIQPCLVMSGGVACNRFFAESLRAVCASFGVRLVVPPVELCTDNGIMIAWNGVEKWRLGKDIVHDFDSVDFETRSPIGEDVSDQVVQLALQTPRIRLVPSTTSPSAVSPSSSQILSGNKTNLVWSLNSLNC